MKGLREKRKEKRMTMCQLANAIGVRQSAVSMWETGKAFPRKEMLIKLCQVFDCKMDELL